MPGFLLHDHGPLPDASSNRDVADPQGHQITATELAVNGHVEQRQIAYLFIELEQGPD